VSNPPPPKIQDYAIIGNGRSAALISNHGSIDWLCWPRFDSASIFGAILDPIVGGHWSIRPASDSQTTRHYIDNTNVLETTFTSESGRIVLTDFMPVTSEEKKRGILWPEHELVRQVKCEQGEMGITVEFDPRLDYGRIIPKIKDTARLGWRFDSGRNVFILRSDGDLTPTDKKGLSANITLKASDVITFSLTFSAEGPAVIPPLDDLVAEKLNLTIDWWRKWAAQSNYNGPYQREVVRSILVLKLLSYAPSGAIVAAPTTSLPEKIGGDLNWDYRFAWLRDAAFTVRALFGLGYREDAEGFVNWLLHATRLTRPRLCVLYDVFGESPRAERMLGHLQGHADSLPVRVGNQARDQFQLDIYGEVVEAVGHFFGKTRRLDHEMQQMLRQCGEYICRHWHEPDNGMWEYRDRRQHYTHSRLLCWVALDRLLQMHERGQIRGIPPKFKDAREKIRREIEERAWNDRLQTYTQELNGDEVDANVLLLALHGFEKADSIRMRQTHHCLRQRLSPAPGLLYRDEQSAARGEGAFALCSFWEVDFLARGGGTRDEARKIFKNALACANDLGLFAEEIDPTTSDPLGNFPQAFTHLGVINAALSLRAHEVAGKDEDKERINELE
jgi:GH15 family glucan-1,4-alpha-glucosidase